MYYKEINMKINIITLNDGYSLSADVTLILKMFQRFFKGRVRCELVNFYQYETQVADINIYNLTFKLILI